jgi:hypothetical protein
MSDPKIDEALAHICYAVGTGAGGMKIHTDAIQDFYNRYRDAWNTEFDTESFPWGKDVRRLLLDAATAMGRTAAQLATSIGETCITKEILNVAVKRVECRVMLHEAQAGRFCTFTQADCAAEWALAIK